VAESGQGERGIGIGVAEIVTALLLAALGALAIADSLRLGIGWAEDGPMAGYFPFWLGVGLIAASLGNAVLAVQRGGGRKLFITWEQARHVGAILAPTIVFVALIGPLGLYLPSVLLVLYFMLVIGDFRLPAAAAVAASVAVLTFVTFEIWFLVPLPKGPIETALGF
jgi:putative tricarboxylic transport membrane protein